MTPYLRKQALFPAQIFGTPHPELGMVVVIPAYCEPQLERSLMALKKNGSPPVAVEVIVVINDSEKDTKKTKKENQRFYEQACNWGLRYSTERIKFHILYHSNLPAKHAGVGLARKIGLDEAVFRLEKANCPWGILVCFDADAQCDKNYLHAIHHHFAEDKKRIATSIYFAHPLRGREFPKEIYRAITQYELHLRYYIHAQRYAGFPFAFQTIGSSMAVRSDAYQKQGGMNRRKAGEDFYFLHKFISLGNFSELRTTRVIPSPRISERVPFGTGRAVGQLMDQTKAATTYAVKSFVDLKSFFTLVPKFYQLQPTTIIKRINQLAPAIPEFLKTVDFENKLIEIKNNTTSQKNFNQRFFQWFNAFMLMKFLHFARDHYYPDQPTVDCARWLFKNYYQKEWSRTPTARVLLKEFRLLDKTNDT